MREAEQKGKERKEDHDSDELYCVGRWIETCKDPRTNGQRATVLKYLDLDFLLLDLDQNKPWLFARREPPSSIPGERASVTVRQ